MPERTITTSATSTSGTDAINREHKWVCAANCSHPEHDPAPRKDDER